MCGQVRTQLWPCGKSKPRDVGYLSEKSEICVAEVLIFCLIVLLDCEVTAMCGQVRNQLW
jgi:hypothetical protein